MRILAGTSGYAFKEWKGPFYPEDLKDAGMLQYYASQFPAVEINNSFYQLPKEKVLRDWASQVPEDFSFAIKASRRITHFARLKPECKETLEYLVRTTGAALAERVGPVLFQLPPNLKKDVELLKNFLALLPEGRRYAMEFRHESWFEPAVLDALREHNIALVGIEQDDFSAPVEPTAKWGYLRLHRFDYDKPRLSDWAEKIRAQGWTDAYVFFKHDHVPTGGAGPLAVQSFIRTCAPS
ncbi:MAG TPA: DUF72 domain-containing protein [Gemmatimonadaceae bacterium]|nr:DUF72 domain-containing protein [Gemmatimonadaceae bacterium]